MSFYLFIIFFISHGHGFLTLLSCNPEFFSLSSYVHQVGRTARAGREGYAVTFVTDNDRSLLKAIVSTCLPGFPSYRITYRAIYQMMMFVDDILVP